MTPFPRRRFLASGLATAALAGTTAAAWPDGVPAAVPDRKFRITMVLGRGESDNEFGFKDFLARRGFKVDYAIRNTGGDTSQLPRIIEEIKDTRPDLIYAWGTPQTRGLVGAFDDPNPRAYIRDIPVVFTFVAAPIDARIVPDLQRPGGNVTGTVHIAPIPVQLNTILAYRAIKRLAVIYNPNERNSVLTVQGLRGELVNRPVELVELPVPLTEAREPDSSAVPELVAEAARRGAEMLYIGPDTFIAFHNRKVLAAEALKHRLPTFSVTELIVRTDRAMLALASSSYGIGRFTAFKAEQILAGGVPPGEIPVETLKRFSVIINMPVVRELEFYPPLGLLNFAEVIDQ